jgi:hypothetical protein
MFMNTEIPQSEIPTTETLVLRVPNEIDQETVSAIAAGSADELIHEDFKAMSQLDALPKSDQLPEGVSSIGDALSRRGRVDNSTNTASLFSNEAIPDSDDTDPTPDGVTRKVTYDIPQTIGGRIIQRALYGSYTGSRAHNSHTQDKDIKTSRQGVAARKRIVNDRNKTLADPIADTISKRSAVQDELDKLFKK